MTVSDHWCESVWWMFYLISYIYTLTFFIMLYLLFAFDNIYINDITFYLQLFYDNIFIHAKCFYTC